MEDPEEARRLEEQRQERLARLERRPTARDGELSQE